MSFPYLDLAGFKARTVMPSADVDLVEASQAGFTQTRINVATSYINSRLRKRYGVQPTIGNSLPLGQQAPLLVAAGTNPPAASLVGRPTLGTLSVLIRIVVGGSLGIATFQFSTDGGLTNAGSATTGAAVVLPNTGLTVNFPTGVYSTDNVYSSATAVPETVLGWIVALVTVDLYRKRGVNPQDPTIEMIREDAARALAELKEAADSKDGLFDLPVNEDNDSAVTTGGPLGYVEASPYTWTDIELASGRAEDQQDQTGVLPSDGSP